MRFLIFFILLSLSWARSAPLPLDMEYLQAPQVSVDQEDAARDPLEGGVVKARRGYFEKYQKTLPKHAAHLLVRDGMIADASNQVVYVWAWGTSAGGGEPVEFFLSHIRGARQYESSFVTDVLPSDIDAGLRHIGLRAGAPFDAQKKQFWPKGDRVVIDVLHASSGSTGVLQDTIRIESSCVDVQSHQPIPPTSHVFVGSAMVPDPADTNKLVYAADEFDPLSICANYNLVNTVLDLPERRPKSMVYGRMVLADPPVVKTFQHVIISFRPDPDHPPGSIPTLEMQVGGTAGDVRIHVLDGNTRREGKLGDMVRLIRPGPADRRIPHLVVRRSEDGALTLKDMKQLADQLLQVEEEGIVRIDAPPAGESYFRAWSPSPDLLNRKGRTIQPWELYLTGAFDGLAGQLVKIEELWKDEAPEPTLHETRLPIATPDALVREATHAAAARPPVLLVFAKADTPVNAIQSFIAGVESFFPIIYVFDSAQSASAQNHP